MSTEKSDAVPQDIPAEVVTFLNTVPLFRMLEFSIFPEDQIAPEEWNESQEELLEVDPATVSRRVLTDLPDAQMLVFDLRRSDEGYPLGLGEMGFTDDTEPLDLTISEYLNLAIELAPLETQMNDGVYPYEAIVAAFDRRGLRDNEFWADYLDYLAESRESTEQRMRYIRETESG